MEAKTSDLSVTYFPYTFLEENELKRLTLYFNNIRLLQVLPDFDPGLPALPQTSPLVQTFCPMSSSSLLETIRQEQRAYHQLASVHQDGGLTQILRAYALQEDFEDSRTGLVAQIRQGLPRLAPEEVQLVNDALFLLFAHLLDRQHLELELQLDRIRALEVKLHEEAGIGTEEERDAVAMKSSLLPESNPQRARYPLQRLRAWTRLYTMRQATGPFLPLTTSPEVMGEISERLPSQLAALLNGPVEPPPGRYLLAVLPDPQPLPLEEILELRESLSRKGVIEKWCGVVATSTNRLQKEALNEKQWGDLRELLHKTADEFHQHWPASDKPGQFLRLESILHPGVQPDVAFSLATGLQPPGPGVPTTKGRYGITLLLSPSALRQDDTR